MEHTVAARWPVPGGESPTSQVTHSNECVSSCLERRPRSLRMERRGATFKQSEFVLRACQCVQEDK